MNVKGMGSFERRFELDVSVDFSEYKIAADEFQSILRAPTYREEINDEMNYTI